MSAIKTLFPSQSHSHLSNAEGTMLQTHTVTATPNLGWQSGKQQQQHHLYQKGNLFFCFFLIPPSASCFLLCMCTFGGGHREVRAGYRILMKWSGSSLEEGLFFIRNPLNLIGILHMKWYTVGFKFIPFTVFSFTTQKKMKNNYEVPNHTTVASSCFIL